MKIFVWNIYKGKNDNYHEDFTHYGQNYDIFMIQEAMTTDDVLSSKLAKDGFRWDFGVSFGYRKDPEKETGTMLGSHVEPTRAWIARTVDNEPIVKTPKTLTMAIYPIQGQEHGLMVINIHGLNMTGQKPFERHLLQAMDQVKDHKGPLVFAGDFNTRTKDRLAFMRNLLLTKWAMTEISFRNDERMKSFGTGHIIDFVFVRGLDIIDSEVLGKLKSSDHKAMLFEAKLAQ
jgi:endonuclease/exonuclease/phosphatase (EEP) superfamily protein YafD